MRVADAMSRAVASTTPNALVSTAARTMSELQIGCLVVMEGRKLAGMLTERDILNRIVAPGRDPKKTRVREVMTRPVMTTAPQTAIEEAADVMATHRIRRLPVLEGGRLAGILTSTDIVRVYLDADRVIRTIALKDAETLQARLERIHSASGGK